MSNLPLIIQGVAYRLAPPSTFTVSPEINDAAGDRRKQTIPDI